MANTTISADQVRADSLTASNFKDFAAVDGGGLNLTIKAGRIRNDNVITDVADQTVVLDDNSTNYVEIDSTGTSSSNTIGFTSGNIPIAIVVTSSGAISSITDKRTWTATATTASTITGTGTTDKLSKFTGSQAIGDSGITDDGATVSIGSRRVTDVSTPVGVNDAATKGYVDSIAQGIDWKQSVRVATTAAGTLATAYENGDMVDDITLATGDRILLKNQTPASENGIYTVNVSGAPTRALDLDTGTSAASAAVFVEEGTANADSGWVCTNDTGADIVGTDGLTFVQFTGLGQIIAGVGLTKTGNTLDVGQGDGISVTADAVAVDATVVRTSREVNTSSPLSGGGNLSADRTIAIDNAKADGTTKGAATFSSSDFNDDGSGLISIDYANGQAASASLKGFLTSADWSTFNNKADTYTTSFTNASLSSGILTVTHSLGKQYVIVAVYDNNDVLVIPDAITATSTTVVTIDLSSFGTIAGTWNVRVVA